MTFKDETCGLCRVGTEAYRVVDKNLYAVAAMIFNPVNATHLNIVPENHRLNIGEFDPNEAKGIFDLQYAMQRRAMELFPDHPPVIAIQTGKLSTVPHVHWQQYSSDAHIRQLYARAHEVADTPIGGRGIVWKDLRTHPVVPGTERGNPNAQDNLEKYIGACAQAFHGTGIVEADRRRLRDLSHELLKFNGFEISGGTQ